MLLKAASFNFWNEYVAYTEDLPIRIKAVEKIGVFRQEQMGSYHQITGVLKEVKSETDAHNPEREHGPNEDHTESANTESAHEIMAANQDAAERVFFIEAIEAQEL